MTEGLAGDAAGNVLGTTALLLVLGATDAELEAIVPLLDGKQVPAHPLAVKRMAEAALAELRG